MEFKTVNIIDKLGVKYEKFNPNPNNDDIDHVDCTIRATIAAYPEYTWDKVFDMLCKIAKDMHRMPDSLEPFIALLTILSGGKDNSIYHPNFPIEDDSKKELPTIVDVICDEDIQKGINIIITETHSFTMKDGVIYDMYEKEQFDRYLLDEVNIVWKVE